MSSLKAKILTYLTMNQRSLSALPKDLEFPTEIRKTLFYKKECWKFTVSEKILLLVVAFHPFSGNSKAKYNCWKHSLLCFYIWPPLFRHLDSMCVTFLLWFLRSIAPFYSFISQHTISCSWTTAHPTTASLSENPIPCTCSSPLYDIFPACIKPFICVKEKLCRLSLFFVVQD